MKNRLMTLLVYCAAFVVPFASDAAELVTNGGFETGNLSGWTCTDANTCDVQNLNPHSGNLHMRGIDNTGFGTLSQTIATVVGQTYDFSFWSHAGLLVPGNILRYQIDGGPIVLVPTTTSYIETTTAFLADDALATINFFFETDPGTGSWRIDDVSVTAAVAPGVAEPGSLTLALAALGGALGFSRRRKAARIACAGRRALPVRVLRFHGDEPNLRKVKRAER
jgi:hypothetical protein